MIEQLINEFSLKEEKKIKIDEFEVFIASGNIENIEYMSISDYRKIHNILSTLKTNGDITSLLNDDYIKISNLLKDITIVEQIIVTFFSQETNKRYFVKF